MYCFIVLIAIISHANGLYLNVSTVLKSKVVLITKYSFQEDGGFEINVNSISPKPTDPTSVLIGVCTKRDMRNSQFDVDEDRQCVEMKNICQIMNFNTTIQFTSTDYDSYEIYFLLCSIPNYLKIDYNIHLWNPNSELSSDEIYKPYYWFICGVTELIIIFFFIFINMNNYKLFVPIQLLIFPIHLLFLIRCIIMCIYYYDYSRDGTEIKVTYYVATSFYCVGCLFITVTLSLLSNGYCIVFKRTPLLQCKILFCLNALFFVFICVGEYVEKYVMIGSAVILLFCLFPYAIKLSRINIKVINVHLLIDNSFNPHFSDYKKRLFRLAFACYVLFSIALFGDCIFTYYEWNKLFTDIFTDLIIIIVTVMITIGFRTSSYLQPIEIERNTFINARRRRNSYVKDDKVDADVDKEIENKMNNQTVILLYSPSYLLTNSAKDIFYATTN